MTERRNQLVLSDTTSLEGVRVVNVVIVLVRAEEEADVCHSYAAINTTIELTEL